MDLDNYVPFGTRKVRLHKATEGEVTALGERYATGSVMECILVPEPEGAFTPKVLMNAGFGSLGELVREWQRSENSSSLRAKVSYLLFRRPPECFEFYFTLNNETITHK